ncbi:MAG: NfeD family protein [Ignavibacteria bacterium]|nr:NfeD family protein [Ignavibacteria bacterium]
MDWSHPAVIWFIIGLVLFIMELGVPGLVIVFFGAGAWLVALLSLVLPLSIDIQLLIFLISSCLFLLSLRKYVSSLFSGRKKTETSTGENLEDFLGEKAVVVQKILPPNKGKVELHGTNWNATSDSEIFDGSLVEIIGKEGLTLKVKPVLKN